MGNNEEIKTFIQKRYGEIASKGSDSCGCNSGCCNNNAIFDVEEISKNIGYSEGDLSNAPNEANMGLGCGNPVAIAGLKEGETVLDLGSGGGFDCFLARRQVGESGYVIGVDMTPEMIRLARNNLQKSGYTNMEFRLGEIEHLPVENNSIDTILSNCVINLSLEKEKVFKEAFRVLKSGGRLSISDVLAIAELPSEIKENLTMMAGCVSGAEHVDKIKSLLENVGFRNICITPKDNSKQIIASWAPNTGIEEFVGSFIIEAEK